MGTHTDLSPGKDRVRLFTNDREGIFLRRPNRFLIIVQDGAEELACHCPNPGRLIEFLFPGVRMILEKRGKAPSAKTGSPPKTNWTIGGVYHRNRVAPLFAARANGAAKGLILKKIIPGLTELHGEYTVGSSRFDFMGLDAENRPHLIEVKACSLVENRVAMFPDAPSTRALKHLEELAALTHQGFRGHVLFVIVHGHPQVFIPNLHTDPRFAAGLSRYGLVASPPDQDNSGLVRPEAGKVLIHASLLRCNPQGEARLVAPYVPVDLRHGPLAESNRGNYLILLEVPEEQCLQVGSLEACTFAPGWYVYTGSAQRNLSHRVNRHLRKIRKHRHWHIDYLTPHTKTIKALPILSYQNRECELAHDLQGIGGKPIIDFGCSDCSCKSHLFYFAHPPMGNRAFVELFLRYRAHFSPTTGEESSP
ncbi:MAG: DNA/RNA nuclease SfsA [Treponema sp.]|jgi:sugar fermentation stimulation protein A|nr:DNA/RNA nuclease SfsA [Treponema sp.]